MICYTHSSYSIWHLKSYHSTPKIVSLSWILCYWLAKWENF